MVGCLQPKLLLVFVFALSGQLCISRACIIDPLLPFRMVKDAVTTTVSAAKTVVVGSARVVKGAYNMANPTQHPILLLSGTASEPPRSGYTPMGCFRDKKRRRDLPHIGGTGRRMNKDECSSKCGILESKYFGLQQTENGEEGMLDCWCGNFFGKYGKGTSYDCTNRCPGEELQSKELCGGKLFNSVYQMKVNED